MFTATGRAYVVNAFMLEKPYTDKYWPKALPGILIH